VTRSGGAYWGRFCHAGDGARCGGGNCDGSLLRAPADALLAAQEAAAATSPAPLATVAGPNVVAVAVLAVGVGVGVGMGVGAAAEPARSRDLLPARIIRGGQKCTLQVAREILGSMTAVPPPRRARATGNETTLGPLPAAHCSAALCPASMPASRARWPHHDLHLLLHPQVPLTASGRPCNHSNRLSFDAVGHSDRHDECVWLTSARDWPAHLMRSRCNALEESACIDT